MNASEIMSNEKTIEASGVIPHEPDYEDPFAPKPGRKRLVKCLHCGDEYTEDLVIFGTKPAASDAPEPLWWCPTPGCDGAGVGFDIHSVRAMRRQMKG